MRPERHCSGRPRDLNPRQLRALTMIELMIVIVLLGILAAVSVPKFADAAEDSKIPILRSNLREFRMVFELYRFDHDDYPVVEEHGSWDNNMRAFLQKILQPTTKAGVVDANGECGPYLSGVPLGWGPNILFLRPDTNPFFEGVPSADGPMSSAIPANYNWINASPWGYDFNANPIPPGPSAFRVLWGPDCNPNDPDCAYNW